MAFRFIVIFLLVHLLGLELTSWLFNYVTCTPEPALMHPQLVWDLLYAGVFYLGLSLGWLLLFKKFHYSVWEMFFLQGLIGVLLEQQGTIIDTLIKNFVVGLPAFLFVVSVYGGAAVLSGYFYMRSGGILGENRLKFRVWSKYLLTLIVLILCIILSFAVVAWTETAIGLNQPDRLPICERPLI